MTRTIPAIWPADAKAEARPRGAHHPHCHQARYAVSGQRKALEQATADLRRAIGRADLAYLAELVAAIRRLGPELVGTVPYQQLIGLDEIMGNIIERGWAEGTKAVIRRLRRAGWRRMATLFEDPWQSAYSLILEHELQMVIPEESIQLYVDTRIPPLRETLDHSRRTLCRDIVAGGVREGLGVREIVGRLEADFFGRSAWHRENIARTESTVLYSHGTVARYNSSAFVTGYEFDAVGDDRTCPICSHMHGRQFAKGELNGAKAPLHFQCRCDLIPVLFTDTAPMESASSALAALPVEDPRRPLAGFGIFDPAYMPAPAGPEQIGDILRPGEHPELEPVARQLELKLAQIAGQQRRAA